MTQPHSLGFEQLPTSPEQTTDMETRNFNDYVLVKVTPAGEAMWDAARQRTREAYPEAGRLERDEEGYTKMQLWEVAQYFGAAMYNGNPNLPLETTFKFPQKQPW